MEHPVIKGTDVYIKLTGKLDFARAPLLMDKLSTLKGKDITAITFDCSELTYISSAGIRAIVFAKQKISPDMNVTMVNTSVDVKEVLDLCGLIDFIEFKDN